MAETATTHSSRSILVGSPARHCGPVSKKRIVGSMTNIWRAREARHVSFEKPRQLQDRSAIGSKPTACRVPSCGFAEGTGGCPWITAEPSVSRQRSASLRLKAHFSIRSITGSKSRAVSRTQVWIQVRSREQSETKLRFVYRFELENHSRTEPPKYPL